METKQSALLVSIEKYVDTRLKDLEIRIEQARVSMEKRLDSMNEFRDALKDQSSKSPSRIEIDTKFQAFEKVLKMLETKQAIVDSKAESWLVWIGLFFTGASFLFSCIGVLVSLFVVFFKK